MTKKILGRAATLAAAGMLVSSGMLGTARAESATFAGFASGPNEQAAIDVATLHANQRAAAAGFSPSQCTKIGQSVEPNLGRYFVEVDLGCQR
ncbi:MAG TPA: hypothetical protein VH912_23135 [Streptosporangiaceae bacterium]|jgi:hypothetical protein